MDSVLSGKLSMLIDNILLIEVIRFQLLWEKAILWV